jgi:hypothetical protein
MTEDSLKQATAAYREVVSTGGGESDTFAYMLKMQLGLQKKLHDRLPDQTHDIDKVGLTVGNTLDYLRDQKEAFDDEYRELVDALPGMDKTEKERSGLWKKWKGNHERMRSVIFSGLTFDEQVEAKMEVVDMFHFMLNMFIGLGMNAEEIFVYYYLKNKENFERQDGDY